MKLEGQEFDTKNLMLPLDIADKMFSKAAKLISGSTVVLYPHLEHQLLSWLKVNLGINHILL